MKHVVGILDTILKFQEDASFEYECMQHVSKATGFKQDPIAEMRPASHWRDLRDHLMRAQEHDSVLDKERFLGSERLPANPTHDVSFPYVLWHWSKHSRRVFQMDTDLQALLRHVTVHRTISSGEIMLPFDAFMLALPEPITASHPHQDVLKRFRSLLIVHVPVADSYDGRERIAVMLFSEVWRGYKPLNGHDRDVIRTSIRKRNWLKVMRALRTTAATALMASEMVFFTIAWEDFIALAAGRHEEEVDPVFAEIARLLVGFILYLSMLPPGSPHRSDWEKPANPGKPDPRSITDGAEICTVASIHRLTPEEQERFLSESVTTGREVSAHFRRGHFRKAPGTGHDPDAPRIVMVKPTIVRRDRLRPGEVVGGALAIVK
jgi:hypothetical protein